MIAKAKSSIKQERTNKKHTSAEAEAVSDMIITIPFVWSNCGLIFGQLSVFPVLEL